MDVFDLINQKAFEQLSPQEKAAVLSEMSEQEYQNLRFTLRQSSMFFQEEQLEPSAATLKRLRARFPRKKNIWDRVASVLSYKIPAYQPAVLMSVMLAFFIWKKNPPSNLHSTSSPEEHFMTWHQDTFPQFYESKAEDSATWLTFKEVLEVKEEMREGAQPKEELMAVNLPDTNQLKKRRKGRSLKDDSLLTRFLVQVN